MKLYKKQSGAAEACWAHNPEVDGSKPSSAKDCSPTQTVYFHSLYPGWVNMRDTLVQGGPVPPGVTELVRTVYNSVLASASFYGVV